MIEGRVLDLDGCAVALLDAVESLSREHQGLVVVTGSHGGLASARRAIQNPPALVVFNDAGVGKDDAGIVGLEMLAGFRIAAVAVAASSARIGDAEDAYEHGVISHVNEAARALGLVAGTPLKAALAKLGG